MRQGVANACVAQLGAGNPTTRPGSPTTAASGGDRPKLVIPYDRYLDQVLGGWIGKSIGGDVERPLLARRAFGEHGCSPPRPRKPPLPLGLASREW